MTDDAHSNRITRHYLLMVVALLMAIMFLVGSGKPPSGSFQAAMWCWIAISAYRGDAFTAKWIVATLIILQVVGFIVRMNIGDSSLSFLFPEVERRFLVVSSGVTVLIFAGIYFYADYLHKQNISHTGKPSKDRSHTSYEAEPRHKPNKPELNVDDSVYDYSRYKKHPQQGPIIAQSDGAQSSTSGKSCMETHYRDNPKEVANKYGCDSPTDDPWQAAIEYFPDIGRLYDQISRIDPKRADAFKSDRMKAKDFSRAEDAYWLFVNDISFEIGGKTNTEMREFVKDAINKGDYVVVRRLLDLSRTLGAENMNSHVLDKFKKSMNYD